MNCERVNYEVQEQKQVDANVFNATARTVSRFSDLNFWRTHELALTWSAGKREPRSSTYLKTKLKISGNYDQGGVAKGDRCD